MAGMGTEELIDAIYSEMAEFGFLTKYVYGEGIEEIDINAWDDVEVQFSGGETRKLEEPFEKPGACGQCGPSDAACIRYGAG